MLTPLKSGLISNSECLLSASALSNIAAHSSKVLSILKVNTEVTEQDIKKEVIATYSRLTVNKIFNFDECVLSVNFISNKLWLASVVSLQLSHDNHGLILGLLSYLLIQNTYLFPYLIVPQTAL